MKAHSRRQVRWQTGLSWGTHPPHVVSGAVHVVSPEAELYFWHAGSGLQE